MGVPRSRWAVLVASVAIMLGGMSQAGAGEPEDAAAAFTACMRANGLPDFPAVTISPDGHVHLEPSGPGFDPFSTEYRAAVATCAPLLPAGSGLPAAPEPPSPPPAPGPPYISCR